MPHKIPEYLMNFQGPIESTHCWFKIKQGIINFQDVFKKMAEIFILEVYKVLYICIIVILEGVGRGGVIIIAH